MAVADSVTDPFLGAKRTNALIKHLAAYFVERFKFWLGAFMQDNYAPGTEPVRPLEEFQMLSAEIPILYETAANDLAPWPDRLAAQQKIQQWLKLRNTLYK